MTPSFNGRTIHPYIAKRAPLVLFKAVLHKERLVRKRVPIQTPNGVYWAYRWVRVDGGEHHRFNHAHSDTLKPHMAKEKVEHPQAVSDVMAASASTRIKVDDLIHLGHYDKDDLMHLTGASSEEVDEALKVVAEIEAEPINEGNLDNFITYIEKEQRLLSGSLATTIQTKNEEEKGHTLHNITSHVETIAYQFDDLTNTLSNSSPLVRFTGIKTTLDFLKFASEETKTDPKVKKDLLKYLKKEYDTFIADTESFLKDNNQPNPNVILGEELAELPDEAGVYVNDVLGPFGEVIDVGDETMKVLFNPQKEYWEKEYKPIMRDTEFSFTDANSVDQETYDALKYLTEEFSSEKSLGKTDNEIHNKIEKNYPILFHQLGIWFEHGPRHLLKWGTDAFKRIVKNSVSIGTTLYRGMEIDEDQPWDTKRSIARFKEYAKKGKSINFGDNENLFVPKEKDEKIRSSFLSSYSRSEEKAKEFASLDKRKVSYFSDEDEDEGNTRFMFEITRKNGTKIHGLDLSGYMDEEEVLAGGGLDYKVLSVEERENLGNKYHHIKFEQQ